MTLNNVNFGDNNMCVPSVISAITGLSTDDAALQIAKLRGHNNPAVIKAVYPAECMQVLQRLGYNSIYVRPLGSLYMTCSFLSTRPNAIYYVGVPHHAVCIEVVDSKVFFLDNHTKQPMNAASSARLMQKVTHVYKIVKTHSTGDK